MHGGDSKYLYCSFLKIESFIFSTDIEVSFDRSETLNRLLPYGLDQTKAIILLHALHEDLSLVGIDLEEEGIDETGYYSTINKLNFKINDLTNLERTVLKDYCWEFVDHFVLKIN